MSTAPERRFQLRTMERSRARRLAGSASFARNRRLYHAVFVLDLLRTLSKGRNGSKPAFAFRTVAILALKVCKPLPQFLRYLSRFTVPLSRSALASHSGRCMSFTLLTVRKVLQVPIISNLKRVEERYHQHNVRTSENIILHLTGHLRT